MLATIVCEQLYVKVESVYQTYMHMHMFLRVGRINPMKDPDASCLSGLSGVTIASRET
jgi:hypothetical protein